MAMIAESALRELRAAAAGKTPAIHGGGPAGADARLRTAEPGGAAAHGHSAAAAGKVHSTAAAATHVSSTAASAAGCQGRGCNRQRQGQGCRPQNTEFRHCASPQEISGETSGIVDRSDIAAAISTL
jgi:hypothetical protein